MRYEKRDNYIQRLTSDYIRLHHFHSKFLYKRGNRTKNVRLYTLKMLNDHYFIQQALQEAQQAFEKNEVPIGAIIVCQQRIIARTHNLTELLNDVTAHAEMQAITAAADVLGGKYLTDCTLYVTIEPCPMCAGALNWAQISKIVYGARDKKRGYSLFSPSLLHPKTSVISGVLEEECAKLMRDFFEKKRK